jgi:4-diphosphocytidyl-2-C-methyl-D-erythritol kinase
MISFPNCKINLGLNIVEKRADGFHNLETVFYPIPFFDALEILCAGEFRFIQTGITIPGDQKDNLCVKAYQLLKSQLHTLTPVHIHLQKTIPLGAGLGGGSSDGAFTLKLLNDIFHLNLSTQQLLDYALRLGSDCPFFILNQPCYATGRGELLQPIELDLSVYSIILINPGIHVNTGWAFSQITPRKPKISVREIVQLPIQYWKNKLINDFEEPVFSAHPLLRSIQEELYKHGALFAAMSGSGSTIFGIFKKNSIPDFKFPAGYFSKVIQ